MLPIDRMTLRERVWDQARALGYGLIVAMLWLVLVAGLARAGATVDELIEPATGTAIVVGLDTPTDIVGLVREIHGAAVEGDWRVVAGLVLLVLMVAVRRFGSRLPGRVGAFLGSPLGGAIALCGLAAVEVVGSALVGGAPLTFDLALRVVENGAMAAGIWHVAAKPAGKRLQIRRAARTAAKLAAP